MNRNAPLGHVQTHVLLVLSTRGESTITDWAAWYPLDEGAVRGAIHRLGRRAFVDVAGFDGRARTYAITAAGEAHLSEIVGDDDSDELLERTADVNVWLQKIALRDQANR